MIITMKIRVKMKNRSHRYDIIELYQDMVANKININVSRYNDDYVH